MKNSFIVLAFLLSATAALACPQPEAQFFGKVIDYNSNDCTFKIDFSRFDVNRLCPLDINLAAPTEFKDVTCSLKNGEPLLGYVVLKNYQVVIE